MNVLEIWTIYDHPTDFPGHYVARLHLVKDGTAVATGVHIIHTSLDLLREKIPSGRVCIKRSDSDPTHIIESWV